MSARLLRSTMHRLRLALAAAVMLSGAETLHAQAYEQTRIVPPYSLWSGYFGASVAIDGDWMVVGAPWYGWAMTYQLDPVTHAWTYRETIVPSDPLAYSFGVSVALDGDAIAIGAATKTSGGVGRSGAVYVYRRDSLTGLYAEEQLLESFAPALDEVFGGSLAMQGDLLLVGAPGAPAGLGPNTGTAFVFRHDDVTGLWNGEAQLDDNNGVTGNRYGEAVGFDGSTAVIGSPGTTASPLVAIGSAEVWTVSGTTWTQGQELQAPTPQAYSRFGTSVAIDGDRIAVGTPFLTTTLSIVGCADVFKRSAGVFSHEQHIDSPRTQYNLNFGNAVALRGGLLVIGAEIDTTPGRIGSAWTYRLGKKKNGPWHLDTELGGSDGAAAAFFGHRIAITDRDILISAVFADTLQGNDSGEVFLFHSAELTLSINPTQPIAAETMLIDVTRGDPGDPILLVATAIDGVPVFVEVALDVFGSDSAWHAAIDAPDPLLGVTVSVRAFKISAGGPIVGSQVVDVDL